MKNEQKNMACSGTYNQVVTELCATLNEGGKHGSGLVRSIACGFVTTVTTLLHYLDNKASDGGSAIVTQGVCGETL